MEQIWHFLDLLVVTVGFYGSESSPKMVSIRSETFWGPVSEARFELRLERPLGFSSNFLVIFRWVVR